ncbi:hypothetical protein N9104_02240 [Pseudomonadales bacterium]|nr:hypothetical protein [bacterium]MDB4435660.1 hypothetical protein [bacterium]MDB4567562.1 hypothetical protein [Pseudomonadales bacterium]|tara:strand:- start:15 stop:683 length:669 start_codon:yes stop_codon:yes gene_type:complete
MKISESTFEVLKNFSTINPSLSFKTGNVLRTVSPQKNILASAVVSESFPQDFAIYEMNQFLGLTSLFEDAVFDFGSSSLTVSEASQPSSQCRYTYTDPSMITSPPEKNLELPDPEVQFDMTAANYKKVVNAANQLSLPEVVVRGSDGTVSLVATDTKNPTSNEFGLSVGNTEAEFEFIFKTENLKFMSDDYKVSVSSKGISHFLGSVVEYWVATEAGSKYNG